VGSFNADGAGNISSAMEDIVDLSGTPPAGQVTFTGGSYSVQSNGRGTIVLQDGTGSGLQLTIVLQSSSQGFLLETDGGAGSVGNFILQSSADFLASSLNGNYVFDFSGVSLTGATPTNVSTVGYIATTGGVISGGLNDINDGNAGISGPTTIAPGTFTLDPTYGTTFGRGTAQFAGHTFAFYIVDNTDIRFIQEDAQGGSTGDGVLQTGAIPTQNSAFTGSFAYLVGGSSSLGANADSSVARFTSAGAGAIGSISYYENNNGQTVPIAQGSNISNATYAIDTTNAGSGRGTLTFTDSGSGLVLQYVFYLSSPTAGVIQETTSGYVADGTLYAQTGAPFTLASLSGNYVFNWSGVTVQTGNVEDYVGQYVMANSATNTISGVIDATSLGIGGVSSFPDAGVQGSLAIASDGSANNAYQIVVGSPISATYNFQAYIVDANTVLLIGTANNRVLAGFVSRQSQ